MKKAMKRVIEFMKKYPGISGVISGILLYILAVLLYRTLTNKPVLVCPNCGAELVYLNGRLECVQTHCGYAVK